MKYSKNILPLLFLFLLSIFHSYSQPLRQSNHTKLINGKSWISKDINYKGSPLLFDQLKIDAKILFNNQLFKDIKLGYDLEQDEVLYTYQTIHGTQQTIALQKERIESFHIRYDGRIHDFFKGNVLHTDLRQNSFYQVIVNEDMKLLITRSKEKEIILKSKKKKYTSYNKMLLLKDSNLYKCNKLKDLTDLIPDKSSVTTIRKYKKAHQLKFDRKHLPDVIQIFSNLDI